MNFPLPNVKDMTDREFILWVCGAVLLYLLWINPASLDMKLEKMGELQAQMIAEHKDLLKVMQVQCLNHAENVTDQDRRTRQQRRCLTLQVNTEMVD